MKELRGSEIHLSIALAYQYIGQNFLYLERYDQSLNALWKCINITSLLSQSDSVIETSAWFHGLICCVYENIDRPSQALHHCKNSLETFLRLDKTLEDERIELLHITLGDVYFDLGQFLFAKEYYLKSLEIHEKRFPKTDHPNLGNIYNNLGMIYIMLDEYQLALENFQKAVENDKTTVQYIGHPRSAEN